MFIPGGRVGVLLIHGLGGTPVELRFIAQGLARAGYTVYCCQLAGHCGTPEELRRSTWQEWYASVEAAHDKLKEHCDVILAGGLSMGGILALHLAQNRPDGVHGLLLYAPTLKLDGWSMPWHSRAPAVRAADADRGSSWSLPSVIPTASRTSACGAWSCPACRAATPAQAGIFSTPLRSFAHFNSLVAAVKPRPRQGASAGAHRASARRRHGEPEERPVPAGESGRAGGHAGAGRQLSHRHAGSAAPPRGGPHRAVRELGGHHGGRQRPRGPQGLPKAWRWNDCAPVLAKA